MANFSGLYYPGESWNLEVEDSMLKKCLLFFDKIYAIVPEIFSVDWKSVQPYEELDPFLARLRHFKQDMQLKVKKAIGIGQLLRKQQHSSLLEIERHNRIERFLSKVGVLRKEGILQLVNPRENLVDPPYLDTESKPYQWGEIDHRYQTIVQHGLSLDKLEAYKPHVLYGSILSDLKDKDFRKIAASLGNKRVVLYKGQAEQNWLDLLGESSGFPVGWQISPSIGSFCGTFVGTVSTTMWAALVVNHALLTSHKYNLIPVTPNNIFYELTQSKLRRMQILSQSKQSDQSYLSHPECKVGFSGFSLAACALPNLELMSFEDVLDLRVRLKDELIAFRHEMSALAERIRVEPWAPKFLSEVEYTVKYRIEPAVDELKRKLKTSREDVVLRALRKAAPKALPVLATIWVGMPVLLVMAVSAGLVSIEIALEHHFERKKVLQSNGLSFLLRLQ